MRQVTVLPALDRLALPSLRLLFLAITLVVFSRYMLMPVLSFIFFADNHWRGPSTHTFRQLRVLRD